MPLKGSVRGLGGAARTAAEVGAVCLGFAVILWSDDPAAWLGLAAALVGLLGGAAARLRGPLVLRAAACGAAVLAARVAGGTAVAALVSVLLALGWWLRLRGREVLAGVAIYGMVVAALGRASWQLLGTFWLLGALVVGACRILATARHHLQSRPILAGETTAAPSLDAESR